MPNTLQFRRGALAGLPSLSAGEPGFTTDQFRLYVGSSGGNRLVGLFHNNAATAAPTVNDDAGDGYSVGSRWIDTTNDKTYVLVDSTVGAAVWQQTSGTGTTGTVAVDSGGTGRTSHTAYAVLCGGTTSTGAQQSVASVGTSGQVLTSNGAGALPTFQTPSSTLDITGLTATDLDLLDEFPLYDASAAANRKVTLDRLVARAATPPPGRLTLSATLPVTTADATSSTYVYYLTGATGNDRIRLWDGTRWVVRPLGTGTAWTGSWAASTVYDLFAYADSAAANTTDTATDRLTLSTSPGWVSGTPVYVTATGGGLTAGTVYYWNQFAADTGSFHTTQADAVAGTSKVNLTASISGTVYAVPLERVAWTNDTTRATALALADGAYYKSGDQTRLYLGTVRTNGSSVVQDTLLARFVWNAYNRVPRQLLRRDTSGTWNYTTATWRSANNSTSNRVEVVVGIEAASLIDLTVAAMASNTTAGVSRRCAVGEDSTSTPAADGYAGQDTAGAGDIKQFVGGLNRRVAVGYHYYQALEHSNATGTTSWYNTTLAPAVQVSGLYGSIEA